ncbi:PREDICTED: disease resistance protein At4g27190-like [Fragaria vesca subsp. vesca]
MCLSGEFEGVTYPAFIGHITEYKLLCFYCSCFNQRIWKSIYTHIHTSLLKQPRGMAVLMEIGTAIVTKLAEYTVGPVIRQVGYVICYKNNLEELQTRVHELGDTRESVKHAVDTEERKGKKVETRVQNWMTEVVRLTKEADDVIDKHLAQTKEADDVRDKHLAQTKEADDVRDKHLAQTKCLIGFCPNLKLRHHLGRKSKRLVLEVAELEKKQPNFDNIAYVAPLEEVCIQDYEAFASRTSTAKAVINELRNPNTHMTGVYGIGGVGKTTLVKEVYHQLAARSDKLFEEVVMVLDLKRNPSIERIQKAIAEKLDLELPESGTPAGRARLISNRIKNKKTLVILDDVWENIDLVAVGLPRMATLKILLTSRSKLVLASDMGTQNEFPLKVLNKEETWRLFKKMAGDIVEKPDIQTIAAKVAEKCGGLPLLIVTVARSLKDSPLHDWKDTFRRLKKFDGKGLEDKTYSAIEWSYDKLNSEELKSVILLCASEVGSANDVNILDLLKYSMGLGFIKNVDTMEEARDALNSLIKKLQYSCLLLDTDDKQWVRIHDLVKHVAQHIAARDHHVLSVSYGSELKDWPDKEFCKKCTRISLMKCQTPELPQVLQCPELTMFHLSSVDVDSREIPSNFFKEMNKLKVLDLTKRSIASLPPSLKCLKDLQTLCLDSCTLGDVAFVGELHNLKMLSFLYSKFKQLPEEIGKLTSLQLLDLTGCSQLEVISPHVISKLIRLEELRMGKHSFNIWEAGRVGDAKRSNASLEELMCLPRLTALQIHVPDANILPADLFTTSKLERFQICIGSMWKWDDVDEALNALKLNLTTNKELDPGLKMLLERTQDLYVEGMEGVNDKFFHELATGGYQQLKHLHVQNNAKFAYTVNTKVGFPNLTWLAVSEVNSLRYLLSSSMARSLSQLKRLQISGCQIMEVIILIEESSQEIAENFFPQLQDLELKGLPNLTKFCTTSYVDLPNPSCKRLRLDSCTESGGICEEVEEIDAEGNLDIVIQHFLFENKGSFPNLEDLGLGIMENWDSPPLHLFKTLKSLYTYAHTNSTLNSLEKLLGLEKVNGEEIHAATDGTFPVLRELHLCGMQKVMNLGDDSSGSAAPYFPIVEILEIADCESLKNLRSPAISFNNLTTLQFDATHYTRSL